MRKIKTSYFHSFFSALCTKNAVTSQQSQLFFMFTCIFNLSSKTARNCNLKWHCIFLTIATGYLHCSQQHDFSLQVLMKFPRLGRTGCLAILATVVFVIFVLGLGIGYGVKGSQGKGTSSGNPFQGASSIAQVISLWTRASTALFTWTRIS